jgi:hypothetical protein
MTNAYPYQPEEGPLGDPIVELASRLMPAFLARGERTSTAAVSAVEAAWELLGAAGWPIP